MLSLVMNPGRPGEQQMVLARGSSTIGRTKDNAIQCLDKSLSRRHAQLDFDGVRLTITDLESKNGVFFRGKRVRQCDLRPGDTFRCGDIRFLVDEVTAPRPAATLDAGEQTLQSPLLSSRPPASSEPVERKTEQRLALLSRLIEHAVVTRSTDDALAEIVVRSSEVLEVDRITLFLLDEAMLELKPTFTRSTTPSIQAPCSARVVNGIAQRGQAASFADVSLDRTLPGDPSSDFAIRGAMGAPMKHGGRVVGLLYADSLSRSDCFTREDLALFSTLANLAALIHQRSATRF